MKDQNDTVEVQGGGGNMPNKGSQTGMNGDSYGADLSPDATNTVRSLVSDTRSDKPPVPEGGY